MSHTFAHVTDARVQPLLKWVGGKRQLLPQLRRLYPTVFNRYIEPFFGSGAVCFDLQHAGRLRDRDVVLVDSNSDLMGCYECVRDNPEAVAADVRDRRFNPLRTERRRDDGYIAYTPELAAMLLYLNRTGFNGLFRVNDGDDARRAAVRGAGTHRNGSPCRIDGPGWRDHATLTF